MTMNNAGNSAKTSAKTLPLAVLEAMKIGKAIQRPVMQSPHMRRRCSYDANACQRTWNRSHEHRNYKHRNYEHDERKRYAA
jgi:hypothetical protein